MTNKKSENELINDVLMDSRPYYNVLSEDIFIIKNPIVLGKTNTGKTLFKGLIRSKNITQFREMDFTGKGNLSGNLLSRIELFGNNFMVSAKYQGKKPTNIKDEKGNFRLGHSFFIKHIMQEEQKAFDNYMENKKSKKETSKKK